MTLDSMTPKKIVKAINAHCDKGNGIYITMPAGKTQRYFRATVVHTDLGDGPAAYVTPDFGYTWNRVAMDAIFSDGNWNEPIPGLPTRRT